MNRKILLKYFSWIGFTLCITTFLILSISGCSGRKEESTVLNDSTIVYPSKYKGGLQPKITLTNRISKKTGKPIKPSTKFNLKEDAKLFAIVDLEKQSPNQKQDLMFHIDWLDSSGNSFYKKRIDISPNDTSSRITSSISISPQKRYPGNYTARLYLFRELIAEKRFLLVESLSDTLIVKKKSESQDTSITIKKVKKEKLKKSDIKSDNIKASLVLCRKISKKTGNLIGAATIFTIKDEAKVKAVVSIEKQDIKTNEQMKFYFNWIGPDGKSFYKKRVIYSTSNPFFTISNSISITPEKRQPGKYKVRVSYRKIIIAEQKFELVLPEKQESL